MHKPFWAALVVATTLLAGDSFGLESWGQGGDWPKNWPAELEPFRKRSSSGSHNSRLMYDIPFASQAEFEDLWPALLRLKSKGAPLVLYTAETRNDNAAAVLLTGPKVRIQCPHNVSYSRNETGSYDLVAPWVVDVIADDGVLPAYIGRDRTHSDSRWEVVNASSWGSDEIQRYGGYPMAARVTLSLYVDGVVVDLNRVPLPPDTEIVDRRGIRMPLAAPHNKAVNRSTHSRGH